MTVDAHTTAVLQVERSHVEEALLLLEVVGEVLTSVADPFAEPSEAEQCPEVVEVAQMAKQQAAEQVQVFPFAKKAAWQSCQECRSKQACLLPLTEAVLKVTGCNCEEGEQWAELEEYRMMVAAWLASAVEEHKGL